MARGKLIVLEGIDGSGKSAQYRRLCARMEQDGIAYNHIVFPRYDQDSSALIRMYLAGAFGSRPDDVNAYAASTFFAVDRYASYRMDWGKTYENGGLFLSDRYTTSNAVHQASKESPERRGDYFRWLYELEYDHMELPRPDLVIYLDVPTELTERLMRHREADTHTHADIHEKDLDYLRLCRRTGLEAAAYYGWTVIHCERNGEMRPIEDIHEEIYRLVQSCLNEQERSKVG